MKTLRVARTGIIGMLLLLMISFFGFGNVRATTQPDHHGSMNHSRNSSSSDCQTRCSSMASTIALPQKEDGEKEKEPDPVDVDPFRPYPFKFADIRKLSTNPDTDTRLLRPPDILALNCIYRI